MAGLAESAGIVVIEMSFDENGLLLRTSREVDPGEMYQAFRSNDHIEVIERYLIGTPVFEEIRGRRKIDDYSKRIEQTKFLTISTRGRSQEAQINR